MKENRRGIPASNIRQGFELTYDRDADDPACSGDLFHFTNGWRACILSQMRAPTASKRSALRREVRLREAAAIFLDAYRARYGGIYGQIKKHAPLQDEVLSLVFATREAPQSEDATPQARADAMPPELAGVAEELTESSGFWRSCSGCHELNEGHAIGTYSAVLRCYPGHGCTECGGIGAVWDYTDYNAMAEHMAQSLKSTPAPQPTQACTCPNGDGSLRHPCPQHPAHPGYAMEGRDG